MPVNYQQLVQDVISRRSTELKQAKVSLNKRQLYTPENRVGLAESLVHQHKEEVKLLDYHLFFLKKLQETLFTLLQTTRYRSINLVEFIQALTDFKLIGGIRSVKINDYLNRLWAWQSEKGYGDEAVKPVIALKNVIAGLVHNEYDFYRKFQTPALDLLPQEIDSIKEQVFSCYQQILEIASELKCDRESGKDNELVKAYVLTEEQSASQHLQVPVSIYKKSSETPRQGPARVVHFGLSGQLPK